MSTNQTHSGSGDNVGGNKNITNNISIQVKIWIVVAIGVLLGCAVYFSPSNTITGIKGNNNNNNDIQISK